jgi:hypothetical protein
LACFEAPAVHFQFFFTVHFKPLLTTMPPRRKAAAKKQEPPKKRARKTTDSSSNTDGNQITELYNQCVLDGDVQAIRDCQGAVSTIVWPHLTLTDDSKEDWKQACHLWALFVADSPKTVLEECQTNDEQVWARIWQTVLNDVNLSASTVHAVIQVLGNDDSNTSKKALLNHLSGVQLWHFVPERIRELELRKSAALRRKFSTTTKPKQLWVVTWIDSVLKLFEKGTTDDNKNLSQDEWLLLTRSLELLIDLLSLSVTREHLVPYLEAIHFYVQCKLLSNSKKNDSQNYRLVQQLLSRIQKLLQFPIRGQHTAMSEADVVSMYHERATILQKLCHRHYPQELPEVIYAGVGLLCNGSYLKRAMAALTDDQVWDLVHRMRIVGDEDKERGRDFWMEILLHHVTIPPFEELSSFPLYPTERVLWNPSVIPPGFAPESSAVLSLPKLQTQFLSYRDYLLRNFELSRLESAYEIRSDIVNVLRRVQPVVVRREDILGEEIIETEFRGWARMALELAEQIRVVKVDPPKLGQGDRPSQVVAEIAIDLEKCGPSIRQEWDSLTEFDNLFLIGVDASQMSGEPAPTMEGTERCVPDEEDSTFPQRYGIMAVRGCMVLHVRDEDGKVLSDPSTRGEPRESSSTKRIFRVALDPAQYAMDSRSKYGIKVYDVSVCFVYACRYSPIVPPTHLTHLPLL